jgi:hypothetical protein
MAKIKEEQTTQKIKDNDLHSTSQKTKDWAIQTL